MYLFQHRNGQTMLYRAYVLYCSAFSEQKDIFLDRTCLYQFYLPFASKKHMTAYILCYVKFPGLLDVKGILHRYMPLLQHSITMKTVVPDLRIITFSQHPNLCRNLCRDKFNDEASELPRSSWKSLCKPCLLLICSNYITNSTNNTIKCNDANISCNNRMVVYAIFYPICMLVRAIALESHEW